MVVGRAHWDCEDYCYGCKFRLSNVGLSNCHQHRHGIRVMFTQTIDEITSVDVPGPITNQNTIYISIGCSVVVITILVFVITFVYHKNRERIKDKTITLKKPEMSDIADYLISLKDSGMKFVCKTAGVRFLMWKTETEHWGKRMQDLIQNIMILANGIMAVVFAEKWNGNNNPLLIINNKFRTSFKFSDNTSAFKTSEIMETKHVNEFVDVLNFWIYLVNMINGIVAFLIIVTWLFTKTGNRGTWIKIRLFNTCSMLGSIFIVFGIYLLCNA